MSKIPITVCIIAKNEEKHIENCLKYLKKYDLEVIVTDTGSTDRTKEIAEKYADKVVDFEWINDFAAARNHCTSFATNNWILAIDCDEYVTNIDVRLLRIIMQKYPRHIGVLRLKNLIPEGNGGKGYVSDDVPRLYNKNYYHFEFPIHEQLRFNDASKNDETMEAILLPIEVIHHGYALTGEEMRRKQERNIKLLEENMDDAPTNAYYYFQMGQSYFVLKDVDKAIECYEKGMSLVDSLDNVYVPEMIMSLAKAYRAKERYADALELLEKYAKYYNTAKFQYEYAEMLRKNDQILKSLMIYIKVTTMQDVET
ncbi:MAG: glycosyltransferase, partial [Lachnospiraceae bacterium]|nr:glycosyltransferase [Lachnospiraceae bacterium]